MNKKGRPKKEKNSILKEQKEKEITELIEKLKRKRVDLSVKLIKTSEIDTDLLFLFDYRQSIMCSYKKNIEELQNKFQELQEKYS